MAGESTPDRILSAALRLFNQFGVERVAVYKIASEIGISPGNLTYHFARKQDIVYRLIANLELDASQVFSSPRNPGATEMGHYIVSLFRLMWRYHFFFESLTYLTATDALIAESHRRLRQLAQNSSVERIEDAVASGDIPEVELPSTPQILAENMWAVWVNRLGSVRTWTDANSDGEDAVYDCCVHHLSIIQPYASRRYILRLHAAVRQILGLDTELSVPAG